MKFIHLIHVFMECYTDINGNRLENFGEVSNKMI